MAAVQESLRALEHKRRKLNNAIQRANYAHSVSAGAESLDLSEAPEVRKGMSDRIGELHTQSVHDRSQQGRPRGTQLSIKAVTSSIVR